MFGFFGVLSYSCSNIPLNTYKNKEPHTGKIVSVKRCVGASLPLLLLVPSAFGGF